MAEGVTFIGGVAPFLCELLWYNCKHYAQKRDASATNTLAERIPQMSDLTHALKAIDGAHNGYEKAEQYWKGNATEIFSTDILRRVLGRNQMEFVFNYARTVITSRTSRMHIHSLTALDQGANVALDDVWEDNNLEQELHDAMEGALVYGDAYLAVWPNEDDGVDVFYNSPQTCRMFYDVENPRKKTYAIKRWKEGEHLRVNLYYPDRIEKYISKGDQTTGTLDSSFDKYIDAEDGETWPLPNETGEIPIFHLRTGRGYGRPEHHDAFGPQNAINKLLAVQISSIDYASFPQRYFLQDPKANDGVADFEHDFGDTAVFDDDDDFATSNLKSGPGSVWSLKGVSSVGQFNVAAPDTFTKPFDSYVNSLATVTQTPLHLFQLGSLPSGESLRAAEAPLNKRVETLERLFGSTITEMASFVLELLGYANQKVDLTWAPAATYDDKTLWETVAAKHDAGVPLDVALQEAGYTTEQTQAFFPDGDNLHLSPKNLMLLTTAMQHLGAAISMGVLTEEEARNLLPRELVPGGTSPSPTTIDANLAKAQNVLGQ